MPIFFNPFRVKNSKDICFFNIEINGNGFLATRAAHAVSGCCRWVKKPLTSCAALLRNEDWPVEKIEKSGRIRRRYKSGEKVRIIAAKERFIVETFLKTITNYE